MLPYQYDIYHTADKMVELLKAKDRIIKAFMKMWSNDGFGEADYCESECEHDDCGVFRAIGRYEKEIEEIHAPK